MTSDIDLEELFTSLNTYDEQKLEEIFKKESLFTTIIEYSTLNESNISQREKDMNDIEIIERNNILDLYKFFKK